MTRAIGASVLVLLGWVVSYPVGAASVGWRNDGTGNYPAATPPSEWARDKNVLWKTPLPGPSYGAPIVVGEHIFLMADPGQLLCINRADGKVVWRQTNDVKGAAGKGPRGGGKFGKGGKGGMGGGDRTAGHTAATPVSDGKHVAAVFGNGVVLVTTVEGKRLWSKAIEASSVGKGHSSSPLLIDGKLIVHLRDLVAVDVATGTEAWRVQLQAQHASLLSTTLGKEPVIICPAGAIVRAKDGKVLARGQFRATHSTPALSGDTVCVSGGGTTKALKLAMTEAGEVTVTSLWERSGAREKYAFPSPLIHDGLFYAVNNTGSLDVTDMKTGKEVYRQRLPVGQVYSSVAVAGGLLYVLDQRGKGVVFKPGRKFERVAVNDLEGTSSCPVFAGDHLYVRGRQNLYCVSSKPKPK